jgi:hypothetical protein
MNAKTKFFVIFLSMVLSGCAHEAMRGSVAMKVSDNEAHVCMGKGEVREGDRVTLYRNLCTGQITRGGPRCTLNKLGMGTVENVLNEHYSVVKFDPGVAFDEKNFVQKD